MSKTASLLVVSKEDISQCTSVKVPVVMPLLGPSSVRIQTKLVALTSNNLSYARNGTLFHWWDTYPVPFNAPSPYNDHEQWGIVPAWGFGEIIESNIGTLVPGTMLWGFWPLSSLPVDLKLEAFEPKGHWKEVSSHRDKLMPLYARYSEVDHALSTNEEMQAWTASLLPVHSVGSLFNRYVFPGAKDAFTVQPQHPLGSGLPWSFEDADLRSTILVSLSAASKSARSLASQINGNRDHTKYGPQALLQVTRTPHLINDNTSGEVLNRTVSYNDLIASATLSWMAALRPKRIVMIDFGVRTEVIESFHNALGTSKLFDPLPSITLIGVGSEMRVLSKEETRAKLALGETLGRIQFNTSGLREKGIETEGPEVFFQNLDDDFLRWLDSGAMNGIELQWGVGFEGDDGVAAVWRDLCRGQVSPTKTCVFRL